jgi:DNA-binding GntR family transcriptional regulator
MSPVRETRKSKDADDAPLRSIVDRHERKYRTVGDMVYGVIREGILKGVFAPGEHLRQDRLAKAIGVSRVPVRSALLQLETEGLITFHPYRGAIVNGLAVEEVSEIYEIRQLLEAHAIRKIAVEMTPERLDALEREARGLDAIEDGEEYLAARTHYYRDLYDGDRNPQLVRLIEKLRVESGRYWLEHRGESLDRPGSREHYRVLEYLRAGDVEGAIEWMQGHLELLRQQLLVPIEQAALPPAEGGT